jgi:hypothetical protein
VLLFLPCLQFEVITEADRVADLPQNESLDIVEVIRSASRRMRYAEHRHKIERRRLDLAA